MQKIQVDITFRSVWVVIAGIGLAWLGLQITEVFLILFLAFIFNAAFRPFVDGLAARRVPRVVSVVGIYFLIFALFGGIVLVVANEFVHQLELLVSQLPNIYSAVVGWTENTLPALNEFLRLEDLQQGVEVWVGQILQDGNLIGWVDTGSISNVAGTAWGVADSLIKILLYLFTTVMVSVYLLLRPKTIYGWLLDLLPEATKQRWQRILSRTEESLGGWMLGQLILMVLIGVCNYVIVWLPSLFDSEYRLAEYALPIALIGGLLEAVPNIGPVMAMAIASIIALGAAGPAAALYIALASVVLQNAEATFIVPKLMQRAVGLDPIITILSVIAAFKIGGVLAALLAVPVMAMVQIGVQEFIAERKHQLAKK